MRTLAKNQSFRLASLSHSALISASLNRYRSQCGVPPKSAEREDFSAELPLAFVLLQRRQARRSTSFLRERGTPIACGAPTRVRERTRALASAAYSHSQNRYRELPYGSSPSGVNERVFRADSRRPRRILRCEFSRTTHRVGNSRSTSIHPTLSVSVEITARRDSRALKASARRARRTFSLGKLQLATREFPKRFPEEFPTDCESK